MKEKMSAKIHPISDPKGLDKDFDYLTNAASACDCTGLIPANPERDGALESYQEVYAYQPPKIVKETKTQ